MLNEEDASVTHGLVDDRWRRVEWCTAARVGEVPRPAAPASG